MAKQRSQKKKNFERWQKKLLTFSVPDRTDSALSVIGNIARLAIKADFGGYGAIEEVEGVLKNVRNNIRYKDRPLSERAKTMFKNSIGEMARKDFKEDADKWVASKIDRMIDAVFA